MKLPLVPGWNPIRVPCISKKEFKKRVKEAENKRKQREQKRKK